AISLRCRPEILCTADETEAARASYERMRHEADVGRRLVGEARQGTQGSNANWLEAWEAGTMSARDFVSESLERVHADPLLALGLLTEPDVRTRVLGAEGESGETVHVRWRHELAVFLLDAGYCRLCGQQFGTTVPCRDAWFALYARERGAPENQAPNGGEL
ncbi:MAG: hypothetical protein U0353_25395, partial [Sandaracinus sp.]